MAIFDPQFKWGTEIEYNLIKVCNEEGSVLFEDKVDKFLSKNKQVSEWLKINTEKAPFPIERDCYEIEAIMGVFKGEDTTNFMKTCDFFNGILECIRSEKNFKCINPDIDKEMILYDPEFTFYGKPQLTISIDITYYPRLFYLYFNGTEVMSLYHETFTMMYKINPKIIDLTIFGFILYINYCIYCISYYISFHNSIIEKMIYVCEQQGSEYNTKYLSFRQEIKDDEDENGLKLLDSINAIKGSKNFFTDIKDRFIGLLTGSTGVSTDAKDLDFFIQYLKLDERYHYFLKEYIKNKSSFDSFTEEDFCDFLKTNKDKKFKMLIEFYEDLPKNIYTNGFIKNIKLISSNSFIKRFIKYQESWSKKRHIKTFFYIKPRTKIERLWKGMSTEYKDSIKSMVKSPMSISFMHRNEITTLETVIDRLKKEKEISNFFETHDVYELFEFKDEQNSDYQVTLEFRDFLMLKELSGLMIGLSPQEQKRQIITIKEFKESINYIFTGFLSRLFTPDSDPNSPVPAPPADPADPRSLSSRPAKKQKVKKVEVEEVEEGPEVPPTEPRSLSSRPSRRGPESRSLSSRPAPRIDKKRKNVEPEMSFKSKKIKSPKKSNSKTKKSKSNSKTKKSKTKSKKSNSKSKTNSKKSKKSNKSKKINKLKKFI
jgi:hypothetical protein